MFNKEVLGFIYDKKKKKYQHTLSLVYKLGYSVLQVEKVKYGQTLHFSSQPTENSHYPH